MAAKKAPKKKSPQKAKKSVKRPLKRALNGFKKLPAKKKATRTGKTVKSSKKSSAKKRTKIAKLNQADVIGVVTHYFPKVQAAVIKLKKPLSVGDSIKIKGHTTDSTQVVTSMQVDRAAITHAKRGQEIGVQVQSRIRQHDIVYKG